RRPDAALDPPRGLVRRRGHERRAPRRRRPGRPRSQRRPRPRRPARRRRRPGPRPRRRPRPPRRGPPPGSPDPQPPIDMRAPGLPGGSLASARVLPRAWPLRPGRACADRGRSMILVHHLRESPPFVINADLIETIEATPDTHVTLTTGKRLI